MITYHWININHFFVFFQFIYASWIHVSGLPFCCRICMVFVFRAFIMIPMSFACSFIYVRVLSKNEAGAINAAMSFVYASTFYFPSFFSSQMSMELRHRLKIHGEIRLSCGVPLLVLNLLTPMLMKFCE